ncbi:ribonuclease P, partial [Listeria innocua]|nr:ribonuclease P [Listeria innocua]
ADLEKELQEVKAKLHALETKQATLQKEWSQ